MAYYYKTGVIVPFIQKFYKQMIIVIAGLFIASMGLMTFNASAADQTVWDQGFESDTAGWLDSGSGWYGTATQVSSGDDGITSSVGSGHAVFEGDVDSGPFSRFDMYRETWTPWTAEVDVYLDPAWSGDQGFDYAVAANGSDNAHQRDYIFHVGTVEDSNGLTGKHLLVNGSNNADFDTNPYKLVNDNDGNYYEVTEEGWYTLQHVFRDQGGSLAVDLNLVKDGSVVWTATRYNAADTIPAEVGGNRYAWFTHIDVADGIAVDNHQLILNLPDPVLEHSINGGGHILDGEGKRKNLNDISFGLDVKSYNTGVMGSATVRMHNVSKDSLDKTTFHATEFTEFNYFNGNANCEAAVNFTANGTVNGEEGYRMIFRAGDNEDTVRVTLFDGNTKVYDSRDSNDFPTSDNCAGTARTHLDNGNITITKYED